MGNGYCGEKKRKKSVRKPDKKKCRRFIRQRPTYPDLLVFVPPVNHIEK
jgi:hypothetical protein